MSEPKEKPKQPFSLSGEPQAQTYRALRRMVVNRQWEAEPGDIVDLSHLPQESIRWFVQSGYYETADGEPINPPGAPVEPCKNCNDKRSN